MCASARRGAEHARVAHRTVYRTCPVQHWTARRAHTSELQRSEPNGLVTWLAHRTVRCVHRQQPTPTVELVVESYKYPQPPPLQPSKHSLLFIQYKSKVQHSKTQIKATDPIKVPNSILVLLGLVRGSFLCFFVALVAWLAFFCLSFLFSKPCK